ncbi:tyrosinase family oxidase copper chaperone [Streptomyces sp. NBC_01361]|uniref:tyrosinase family oxidase copper chaperone n=1 Tax=Streptomyces sp. NBC_01361 TaxID=2903838 RepID=UPI002E36A9DA|nr:tyrosinase family oxidase copper chaperone [Streptomyces sp. NBC_01361]
MEAGTPPVGLGPVGRWVVTRRTAVRRLIGVALAAAVVPAAALVGRAFREPHDDLRDASGKDFEETYRGRHIRGTRGQGSMMRAHLGQKPGQRSGRWDVTVDGRPLHLMRRADGSYLSMVDHYQSYPTPLAAARGAVDELGDQILRRQVL